MSGNFNTAGDILKDWLKMQQATVRDLNFCWIPGADEALIKTAFGSAIGRRWLANYLSLCSELMSTLPGNEKSDIDQASDQSDNDAGPFQWMLQDIESLKPGLYVLGALRCSKLIAGLVSREEVVKLRSVIGDDAYQMVVAQGVELRQQGVESAFRLDLSVHVNQLKIQLLWHAYVELVNFIATQSPCWSERIVFAFPPVWFASLVGLTSYQPECHGKVACCLKNFVRSAHDGIDKFAELSGQPSAVANRRSSMNVNQINECLSNMSGVAKP